MAIAEGVADRVIERSARKWRELLAEDREALLALFQAQQDMAYNTLRGGIGKIHDHLTRLSFELHFATRAEVIEEPTQQTILLAEDEPVLRALIKRFIENRGTRVVVAENGEQARELLGKVPSLDAVVSDYTMPLNGHKVAEEVLTKHPGLPLVITSGYPLQLPPGCEFLSKPFGPSELGRVLDRVLPTR